MKPNCLLLFSFFFACTVALHAQEIEREVVATSGDQFSGAGLLMEWTLGEVMIDSGANDLVVLTQGFQQGSKAPTGISETHISNNGLQLYPNPTKGLVYYDFNQPRALEAIVVFDMNGKQLVYESNVQSQQLDLSNLARGMYALRFLFENTDENFTELIIKR
jgi:hypothetical protein